MIEQNVFVISQYFMVIFAGFMIGCGVLFLYYWALPSLRKLGYVRRIELLEAKKEYLANKAMYKEFKEKIKHNEEPAEIEEKEKIEEISLFDCMSKSAEYIKDVKRVE